MSDCFDHEADAWDSYDSDDSDDYAYTYSSGKQTQFKRDPLYYHSLIEYKLLAQSDKAYFIKYKTFVVWVPKSICKNITETSMYVHTGIFDQCLEGAKKYVDREGIF